MLVLMEEEEKNHFQKHVGSDSGKVKTIYEEKHLLRVYSYNHFKWFWGE